MYIKKLKSSYINNLNLDGSFDTHIAMVYDILCHMTYVVKCHIMSIYDIS